MDNIVPPVTVTHYNVASTVNEVMLYTEKYMPEQYRDKFKSFLVKMTPEQMQVMLDASLPHGDEEIVGKFLYKFASLFSLARNSRHVSNVKIIYGE